MNPKPYDLGPIDSGATMVDRDRPISNTSLRRNATELMVNEPSGTERRPPPPVEPNPPFAGATQVISVPQVIVQAAAIIEGSPSANVAPSKARGSLSSAEVVAEAAKERSRLSGSPVLVLSPAQAEQSRSVPNQQFEPKPASATGLPAAQQHHSLATVLEAPVARVDTSRAVSSRAASSRGASSRGASSRGASSRGASSRGASSRAASSRAASSSSQPRGKEPSPSAIAKLGLLTRRYPVGVIGGAAVGALMLGVFLVGAAQILGLRGPVRAANRVPAIPASVVTQGVPSTPPLVQELGTAKVPMAVAADANGALDVTPRATSVLPAATGETDPNLQTAVGTLFSGRLIEAEQAYRDLATRHPEVPAFGALARILGRRNSPECRPGNPTQNACPTVKP